MAGCDSEHSLWLVLLVGDCLEWIICQRLGCCDCLNQPPPTQQSLGGLEYQSSVPQPLLSWMARMMGAVIQHAWKARWSMSASCPLGRPGVDCHVFCGHQLGLWAAGDAVIEMIKMCLFRRSQVWWAGILPVPFHRSGT